MSRHVLVIALMAVLPSLFSSRSYDSRENTPASDSFTWKFGEVNHLIECDSGNIDAMRKELPHFVLFIHRRGMTLSTQRLYELTDIAKKMKKEIHQIPLARTVDEKLIQKYANSTKIISYVYFRHGEPIVYHSGRYKEGRLAGNQ